MLGSCVGRESAAGSGVLHCRSVVAGAIPPPPLAVSTGLRLAAGAQNQILAPQHLGDGNLRRLKVHAFDLGYNIEDRCRSRAGAVRLSFDRIPAPGRMLIPVVWIGTANMA